MNKKPKRVKCKKCRHSWNYKGESEYYVTCPCCMNKVNVQKHKL